MDYPELPDGWEFADRITQAMLEEFERDFQKRHTEGRSNYRGAIVRAALASKWLKRSPSDDIDGADPREIGRVAIALDELYAEMVRIDVNLS